MRTANPSSFLIWITRRLTVGLLLIAVGGALALPQHAVADCETTGSGDWNTSDNWTDCSDGVPGSGQTAVINSGHSIDVTSNTTIGTLTINDDAGGVFLSGGNLTVENDATVGQSTSPGSAKINTFEGTDETSISSDGKLTVQGSLTAYGEVNVFRQDGGSGELEVTDANGSGDFTLESSGTFNGGTSAPANVVGTLINNNGDDSNIVSERCYAESGGNWGTTGNWAPIGGTAPSKTCDLGGDGSGIPGSGEGAEINAGITNSNSRTVGELLTRSTLVVENDLTVETRAQAGTSSNDSPTIRTYTVDLDLNPNGSGVLTVNGSLVIYSEVKVDRESGGVGALNVTGSNGTGDLTVESTGVLNVNQEDNSTSASISIAGNLTNNSGDVNQATTELTVSGIIDNTGTVNESSSNTGVISLSNGASISVSRVSNDGTIQLGGGTMEATGSGVTSRNGLNSSAILNLQGGTIDVDHTFVNESAGTIDYTNATLQLSGDFENDGAFTTNSDSKVVFDGDFESSGNSQELRGTSFTGDQSFRDFTVNGSAFVDPSLKVGVNGDLNIQEGGQLGEGLDQNGDVKEDSDLRYEGNLFSAKGDLYANKVEFAANNLDSDGNTTEDPATTVEGAVFAEVRILNTTEVEVGQNNFTVFGLVGVNENCRLDVATNATTLTLNGDFLVNGILENSSGSLQFQGTGRETCCSPDGNSLDDSSPNDVQDVTGTANIDFNTVTIQDTDDENTTPETTVNTTSSSSATTFNGDLTIDEANLTTARPLILKGNLTVQNNGDIEIREDRRLTFSGSDNREVTTPGGLEVATVEVNKGSSNKMTLNNPLTITDRLLMTRGELEPTADLNIQGQLVLGSTDGNDTPTLDVTGGGGTATLVSDENNDAYVQYVDSDGDGTVDGSVNGKLTYERHLEGGANWFYVGTPVDAGTNTSFDEFLKQGGDNNLLTKGVAGSDKPNLKEASVRLYDETADGPADADDNGWKGIDCSGYSGCVTDLTSPMGSGRGYAVYVYSDDADGGTGFPKTINSNVEPLTSTSFTFSQSDGSSADGPGIDVTDNHGDGNGGGDGSIGDAEGWNLLSNPYFSTVDFCAMNRGDNLSPVVWVWDPFNAGDGTSTDGYATYNCDLLAGGGSNEEDVPGGATLDNGYLAPHQAFFVKATDDASSGLGLSIDDITGNQINDSGFFLRQQGNNEKPPVIVLQLDLDGLGYGTSVGFLEDRSKQRDQSDGVYLGGSSEKSGLSFYSLLDDGTALNTNALPRDLSESTTVPLAIDGCNYDTALKGQAKITWPTLRNIPASWGLVLKDTETGDLVDLQAASEYAFDYEGENCTTKSKTAADGQKELGSSPTPSVVKHSVAKNGTPDTRFQLIVKPNVALPVELTDFTAETDQQAAVLNWSTASEQDNAGFYVQRMTEEEDSSFTTIDDSFVEGTGSGSTTETKSYSYRVQDLEAGTHTFRLKQVDTEGSTSFTDPVEVKVGLDGQYKLSTYPNPARSQATLEFAIKEQSDVTISLFNTLGQKVRTVYRGATPAEETKRVQIDTRDLSSGVYFVRMTGEGVSANQRMTVVK